MTQVGTGKYTYEFMQDFPKLPAGQSFGHVSAMATDSQDRLYVFQRKDPPVMIFDGEGTRCKQVKSTKHRSIDERQSSP